MASTGPARGQAPTVGILAPFFAGSYYGPVVAAIAHEAWQAGNRVVAVQTASYEAQAEREDLVALLSPRVARDRLDGVIAIGGIAQTATVEELQGAGKPVVAVSSWGSGSSYPVVTPDNTVAEAVEHLLAHGHTQIAFAGCLEHFDISERYQSFCATLRSHGLEPRPELLFRLDGNTEPGGQQAASLMIAAGMPSTAVVMGTDLNAVGLISVLKQAGYRLPEDQAIVGFDNLPASALVSPGLSTMSQDFADLGRLAARLLLGALRGDPAPAGRYFCGTSFVVRESCGCTVSTTVPAPETASGAGDPVQRFVAAIGEALSPGAEPGAGRIADLAQDVGSTFAIAAGGDLPALARSRLSAASKELYLQAPSPQAFAAIVALTQRLSTALAPTEVAEGAKGYLEQCIVEVSHGLSQALVGQHAHDYLRLRKSIQDEYLMSLDLLGSHKSDPRTLRWLERTPARAAVLGLWPKTATPATGLPANLAGGGAPERPGSAEVQQVSPVLDVGGTFDATQGGLDLASMTYPVESFPPDELMALAEPGEIAFLFPVRSGGKDWGFLAALSPFDSAFIGQDTYFEWSAMLSRALERQEALTQSHELELQLRRQALYDNLTGLPNRVLFLDRLAQAVTKSKRQASYEYAVLWVDLDGFKVVNDSLGHMVGDQLLVQVAQRIKAHVRETDTAARFGGDEFAVLLDMLDVAPVDHVVDRLLRSLAQPYPLGGNDVVVTASIGVASSATGYESPEEVLRDADIAMYQAKAAGRGTFATFDASMRLKVLDRLKTETELRYAIDHGQLELHYQPMVRMCDQRVTSLEALVRWRRPGHGLIGPAEFLEVAEDSGLIVPLGRWVLSESCRQIVAWEREGRMGPALRLSVNLSHREFWDARLIPQIEEVLNNEGVSAERLIFEITEGVIMNDPERALGLIQALHDRGALVYIDDFGTGQTSLEALHWLPVDALKIDRGFVARLKQDPDGRAAELVRVITALAMNLGLDVICEGVETSWQAEFLRELGCPLGQGYLFSPPAPAAQLSPLLAAEVATTTAEVATATTAPGGPLVRRPDRRPVAPTPRG